VKRLGVVHHARLSLRDEMQNAAAAQPLPETLTLVDAGLSLVIRAAHRRIRASS
jgi:hypothetical protein